MRSKFRVSALVVGIFAGWMISCGGGRENGALVAPTVATQPLILTQPESISVQAGQKVVFSVVGSGTAPLTYQWRKSGVVTFSP